jgi:hypothetical protein
MPLFNGTGVRLMGWLKGKLDQAMDPDKGIPDLEEEGPTEPVVSLRFKVTLADKRVLFVYGRDEAEATSRLAGLDVTAIEYAGNVENGVVYLLDEEVRAAMASTKDERIAPMK